MAFAVCRKSGDNNNNAKQPVAKFYTFLAHGCSSKKKKQTTTMEMTSAIAAAVCSAGPKNGSVVRSLRLGGWGDGLKSLTLTMKFATMPRVC